MARKFSLLDEADYFQLKNVIEKYNSEPSFQQPDGDPLYLKTIRKRDIWEKLDVITLKQVRETVLDFLNKWKCRISYDCAEKLQEALKQTHELFQLLRDMKLETVYFNEAITGEKRVKDVIKEIFDKISSVKAGKRTIGFTATTKIMHMVVPELFVMCDEYIREEYGCAANSEGYLVFLSRMQKSVQRLIKEKPKDEICKELHNDQRSLTKILDEYNYYTITWQKRRLGQT